ncbi:MAG: autotransporter domain-containing protein, partial [Geminicoccaceae bacterium]
GLQGRTGANIIIFDVNGIFNDIQTNPDRYGITNTTDACIDTPACIGADLETQNQFLFFDGIHPTAGIHAQVAQLLATTVRAPATLAAQGEVTLIAAEDFQRALIESFKPIAATASVDLGSTRGAAAELDTAGSDSGNPSYKNPTSLFLLVDRIDGDRGERQGALGYRYDLGAVTAGLRRQLKEHLTLGGAFRIGSGDADIDGGDETFDHRDVQLGLSATFGGDSSYIMGFANLGYTELRNIERRTAIDQVATSGETDAILFGAGVAAGHLIPLSRNIRVGPIGSLRYSVVNLEGYVESGPNFLKQKVENQNDIKSLVLSLGSVLEMDWETGEDKDIRLRLSALLEHDFNGGERTITSAFVTSPTTIETTIDERDRTTARLGADVGFSLVAGFGLGVGYETLVGLSGGGEHTIFGRATLNF